MSDRARGFCRFLQNPHPVGGVGDARSPRCRYAQAHLNSYGRRMGWLDKPLFKNSRPRRRTSWLDTPLSKNPSRPWLGRNSWLDTPLSKNPSRPWLDIPLFGGNRKSQQRERRPTIPAGLRADVLVRDKWTCQWCGRTPERHGVAFHVDHILPVSKNGKTVLDNLQTLCEECNLGKGNRYSV